MPDPLDAWRSPVPGIAAHRGGRGVGPENTLVGITAGLSAGATHIEVDVRGTADGVPVLMHDETIERTCRTEGTLEEMTLDEVKTLDPCTLWSEHAGVATGERDPPAGTPRTWYEVPTLSELLDAFPGVPLILDLKDTAPPEAVGQALENGWRRPEDVIINGFDDDVLDATAEHVPEVPRGPGYDGTEAFYAGEDVEADAIMVPLEHEGIDLVDAEVVERAHAQGKAFWVWTINDLQTTRELMALGVDGIVTDQPGKLSRERTRQLAS